VSNLIIRETDAFFLYKEKGCSHQFLSNNTKYYRPPKIGIAFLIWKNIFEQKPGKSKCRYRNRKSGPANRNAGIGIEKAARQIKMPVQESKKRPGKLSSRN